MTFRYSRTLIGMVLFFFALCTSPALEIRINGDLAHRIALPEILGSGYEIPVVTDSGAYMETGLSLLEAVPLLLSCHRIDVLGSKIEKTWTSEDLADTLAEGFLLASDSGIHLYYQGSVLADIDVIDFWAEPLETAELTVWLSWEGVRELKAEIQHFADLHGLRIKNVETPNIKSKLISHARGGSRLPDVIMVQSDYLPELTASRILQPVKTSLVPSLSAKSFKAMSVDGKLMAAPFYFDTQLVYINTSVAKAPSVDWSLSDMEALARELEPQVAIPMAWNAYSGYWLAPFLTGFGEDPGDTWDIEIDGHAAKAAVAYLLRLQEDNLLTVLERDAMITLFAEGEVAMILSGSYSIPLFHEIGIDLAVLPIPWNDYTDRANSPFLDYKGFAVTRRTRNPVLARRLIQYLCGIGVQTRFTDALYKLPADMRAFEIRGDLVLNSGAGDATVSSAVTGDAQISASLATSYERGIVVPPDPAYRDYKNVMWKVLKLIFSGHQDVPGLLEQGQQLLRRNR